jgi:hypothetical protein
LFPKKIMLFRLSHNFGMAIICSSKPFHFRYKGHRDDNPPTIKPSGKYPDYSSPKAVCIDVDSNLMFASAAYAFNVSDQSKMVIADDVFGKLKPSLRNAFSCDCQGVLCFTTFFPELKKECKSGNFGFN